ncbi:hypothetical protein DLAC_05169 [Tieghemostelium lacteum]|uniref:Transmembrane protein n=1 Tax=Tieghemostelium lacteum TaxID=361077 RepID=A0A151ZIF6_TIELA|nr:hypothetical protein DLAC_05169 [Tieghemostelium lacteum]|eukprot:KYQ93778.1 hypothetical protein DLAC_05169 [Tieghemostelium lacteum]
MILNNNHIFKLINNRLLHNQIKNRYYSSFNNTLLSRNIIYNSKLHFNLDSKSNISSLFGDNKLYYSKSNSLLLSGINFKTNNNNSYSSGEKSHGSSEDHQYTDPNSSFERTMIFDDTKTMKHKLFFAFGIVQILLYSIILEDYYTSPDPSKMKKWFVYGSGGVVFISQIFLKNFNRKNLATICTYNKGRIVEFTTYNMMGNPTLKRTITINKINGTKGNAALPSLVKEPNQSKSFYVKVQGDSAYYQGNLKDSKVLFPHILEKIINNNVIIPVQPKKKK